MTHDKLVRVRPGQHSPVGRKIENTKLTIENSLLTIENSLLKEENTSLGTDPVTGLPNRALFEKMAEYSRGSRNIISILMIDIDKLKETNDTRGHPQGDRLIKSVADFLSAHLRPDDVIGRIGGDEFCIIMNINLSDVTARYEHFLKTDISTDDHHEYTNYKTYYQTYEENIPLVRLMKALDEYNQDKDVNEQIHFSIGIASSIPDLTDKSNKLPHYQLNETIQLADDRMYAMKETHRPSKNGVK